MRNRIVLLIAMLAAGSIGTVVAASGSAVLERVSSTSEAPPPPRRHKNAPIPAPAPSDHFAAVHAATLGQSWKM